MTPPLNLKTLSPRQSKLFSKDFESLVLIGELQMVASFGLDYR